MAKTRASGTVTAAEQERRQLLIRGGLAAGVIVAMLVGLVLWERSKQEVAASPTPLPVAPLSTTAQSVPPVVEQEPEPSPHAAAREVVEEVPASDPVASAPVAKQNDTAEVVRSPARTAAPVALTSAQTSRVVSPSAPVAAASHVSPKASAKATPLAVQPPMPQVAPSAQPAQLVRSVQAVPAASSGEGARLRVQAEPLPPPGRLPPEGKAFALQVGVFVNARNAEELRARLSLAGIPSQVETRVQVGPFHSREEAIAAQTKLKAQGLDRSQLVLVKP